MFLGYRFAKGKVSQYLRLNPGKPMQGMGNFNKENKSCKLKVKINFVESFLLNGQDDF